MGVDLLHYDSDLKKSLAALYGDDVELFLRSISEPGSRYYLRVNTLRISVDEVVERLRSRGIEVYRDEHLPEAIYTPVKGPYKVEVREKVVVADKYAAESVYMGSNLYVPGVVRCSPSISRGDVITVVSETGVAVAEGVATLSCQEMLRARKGLAVEVTVSRYKVPPIAELPEYQAGFLYPQSLPAMYVSRVLDPRPGELVVDMCAAPGGKTGHIIELSRGRAYVLAFDRSKKRLEAMAREMERLGHRPFVEMWRADSRYIHIDFSWLRADRVVVDLPCTALGVRPKLFDSKTYRDVVNASRYQVQFLKAAAKVLKKGGILVYSTYTVTVEENEYVVERLLDEERCLEPESIEAPVGSRGFRYSKYGDFYLRFHPHIHGTPGYFIAKLIKKC